MQGFDVDFSIAIDFIHPAFDELSNFKMIINIMLFFEKMFYLVWIN